MRLYKISTDRNDEPQVVEMMVKKETEKTVTVSDGFMAYTVRKADLPFYWRCHTLIADDPAKGRKEWNRKTQELIDFHRAKADRLTKWLVKELE